MTRKPTPHEVLDCVIIGAGIAGLSAALELESNNMKVAILEKGRGLGGRMATRRMNGAILDHGAQFFTAKEDFLTAKIHEMLKESAVTEWHKNPHGVMRYRGHPGMTSVAKYYARSLDIRKQHLVTKLSWHDNQWHVLCENGQILVARNLLSTAPMPQSLAMIKHSRLVMDPEQLQELEHVHYSPTIALLILLKSPSSMKPPGILQIDEDSILQTITDNQVKGISDLPALTIHSSHSFAEKNLEDMNESTGAALIDAALEYVQFEPQEWKLHRWRYAQCVRPHQRQCVQLADHRFWLAGDSFGNTRLEQAGMSGIAAAKEIISQS